MAEEKKATAKKTAPVKKIDPKTGKVTSASPAKKATTKKEATPVKKTPAKKTASATTKKSSTTAKKTSSTVKKTPAKKAPAKKATVKEQPKVDNVPLTMEEAEEAIAKLVEGTPTEKKKKFTSKELTIETPKKEAAPIVRPTPKKQKELTKEEKVLYKQLDEAFTFVANLTTVIEDRTMDRKQIPDLTIGELHVIETVNKHNNKPMSVIADCEKITVGALTICVNRLVQKGYLLRIRDELDRRVILLSVTQKGKKIIKIHDKFHNDILGLALEHVNLSQATKVMQAFAHTLEVYYDPSLLDEPAPKPKKRTTKK